MEVIFLNMIYKSSYDLVMQSVKEFETGMSGVEVNQYLEISINRRMDIS